MEDLATQRIYALASEYEDLDDPDRLRADSVLALAVGKGDLTGEGRIRERDRDCRWLIPVLLSNRVGHYNVEPSKYKKILLTS